MTTPRALRPVGILGTGHYVPEKVLSNFDLEKLVDTSDEWIFARTGMRERRIAAPEEATSDLCIQAGRRALENAGVDPEEIGLIIVATVTPDHLVPATACIVQNELGCTNAGAFDLEAACSGFVTNLSVAQGMIANGTIDKALIIGGECMSRILDYEDRASCILFGDGAGAAVIGADAPRGRVIESFLGADGSGGHTMRVHAGGSRRPVDQDALAERMNYLRIKGNEVFKFAVSTFRTLMEKQMRDHDFGPDDLGLVVPHQVNYRIIESALKKLEVPEEKIFINLEKYGNTSGASVGIALDEAIREGRVVEGKFLSLIAFGAGLTWSSALLRW
ncbi:MAG: 3-oxoacyl-ACP synthase [Planctomycetes bacterium]|nr:3-oxoacyl-ACP synthase [Planctomycetota bacterium]